MGLCVHDKYTLLTTSRIVLILLYIYYLGKKNIEGVCEVKHHKDKNEPSSRGGTQSVLPDVIEAPSRTIQVPTDNRRLKYGTIGTGLDLGRLVWPKDTHIFSSQSVSKQDLAGQLPGRLSKAKELGPAGGVRKNVLRTNPIDVLLVDGVGYSEWGKWIDTVRSEERPKMILWFEEAKQITYEKEGPVCKNTRKKLQKAGYRTCYWFLQAEDYGAALVQERIGVLYIHKDCGPGRELPSKPIPMELPARAMSNLLMPVGVPWKAYCRGKEKECEGQRFTPCEVKWEVENSPIYETTGPMPDHPQAWIRSDRGVRRLQHEELAKAKGILPSWLKGDGAIPLRQSQVDRATCVHLWSAAMDVMRPWLLMEEEEAGSEGPKASKKDTAVPTWDDGEDSDEKWQWEVPDLSEGGEWFLARVATLKEVIKGAPNPEELYEGGLKALAIHRGNYTDEGPKRLQLLW